MVEPILYNRVPYIFPIGDGCMVSFLAANRLEKQLKCFYPRQHLSYVFEFRVTEGKEQVDLAMAFAKKDDLAFLKEHYAKSLKQKEVADWLKNCFELIDTNKKVKSFWIEVDLNGLQDKCIPSLFISPKEQYLTYEEIHYFVDVLTIYPQKKQGNDLLKKCINALEDGQYIEHLGVMHSRRKTKTTRMYIRGFTVDSLFVFLSRICWPGNRQLLAEQLKDTSMVAYISVAVEYNDDWLPTIGVEFHLKEGSENSKAFLSILRIAGFCSSQRVKSIVEILQPQKIRSDIVTHKRSLSHFKLNIDTDGSIEPKVYVQLIPDYISILGF